MNQNEIAEWADATFGPADSVFRVACRANEEVAELLRISSVRPRDPKVAEEAADVYIVMCRVARNLKLDLNECARQAVNQFQSHQTVAGGAVSANLAFSMVLHKVLNSDLTETLNYFIGIVVLNLRDICRMNNFDLQKEVSRKMEINKNREWNVDGTGHGYHVR